MNRAHKTKRETGEENAQHRILEIVRSIPKGRVCSYGEIARLAGLPRRARWVGTVLKTTTAKVPWQRVVNAQGRIAFPLGSDAQRRQRALLEREGVRFIGERIDLSHYRWPSSDASLDEFLWDFRKRRT
jgi:methylated-DNA-protein-cysteine methyltransferase-like protein